MPKKHDYLKKNKYFSCAQIPKTNPGIGKVTGLIDGTVKRSGIPGLEPLDAT